MNNTDPRREAREEHVRYITVDDHSRCFDTEAPVPAAGAGQQLLLTVPQALQRLQIGRSKLYELLGSGEIESIHIGSSRRIPADALESYVQRKREDGAQI